MKRIGSWTVLVVGLCTGAASTLAAEGTRPEKWSDPKLTVTEGLWLWLDASRLTAAREALGLPAIKPGDPLDQWLDGSGHKRDIHQKDATSQPSYSSADGFHAIRYSGTEAHLTRAKSEERTPELTVFLVAAPLSNAGAFVGPLALSAPDRNDYETGLNIDQGPYASQRFDVLNVEGAGAGGAQNLLKQKWPFGEVVRICVTSKPGKSGIVTWVNGQEQGRRDRAQESSIAMDRLVVGARFYTNFGPPAVRGFFEGEIAEVLVFDHALSKDERTSVEGYLAAKYDAVPRRATAAVEGQPLVQVDDPPAVQVLVPGFVVKRLPVDLVNVNNVLYRPDGRLIALGYDGNVFLLSDTNGDGLEDHVHLFWENKGQLRAPIGMALTPPEYKHGDGVFVAAKGKCLLLTDTNGDDKADREIVVAKGWQELPHGVDALGVAVDPKDHSVYLGIGTKNFTDPYGRGEKPAGHYPLDSERGTVLRIAPDFKSREIFATGIRFPVSMRFNGDGELFCSDQEGATWLPNGNPFDELLHLQRGRHYGFPPRHPQHLPDVIDEPSVFDYAPQHQSTCGMNFNELASSGGEAFGPAWWRSDLFVAGYSRGKLYRTRLVKTLAGYVAQNQLLACLDMLTCDVCVSPRGELTIAAHSGGPDWGSGPTGKGVLYKVIYQDPKLPQPTLVWAQTPHEVRVAFDRPLEAKHLAGLQQSAAIAYGRYVAAGDRFESLRPGYQAVQDQLRSPRFELPIYSLQVSADQRTLILSTGPQRTASEYALTLSGLGRSTEQQADELPQHPQTDLQYNLCGLEAAWEPAGNGKPWRGWLPHLDLNMSQQLTANSADHDALWEAVKQPGELKLKTSLCLENMLRPAVQPGSKIDYEWPIEQVTITLRGSTKFTAIVDGKPASSTKQQNGSHVVTIDTVARERLPLEVALPTGKADLALEASWQTQEDSRPRALPLVRFALPWSSTSKQETPELAATDLPELQGGNWGRGKALFFGDQLGCSKCHTFRGKKGGVGPDLSNLPQRDYHSVLRDINEPNFAINPDFISQSIVLVDGRILTGSVRTEGDRLMIGDAQGRVTTVANVDIDEIQPSRLSTMPEGLLQKLDTQQRRDLLTFLLTKPPRMPDYGPQRPPPPRSKKDVEAILAGAPKNPEPTKELRIVLVAGRKDHGPGEHDYPAWQKVWQQLLSMSDMTDVETATDWPSSEQLESAHVLVFYQQGTWNADRARDLDAFVKRGGGAVYIHYAVDGGSDPAGFAERIGLAWKGGQSKFRHGPLDLTFEPGKEHPIARNFDKLDLHDESYWQLSGDPKRISLLATGREDDRDQPLFWTREQGNGRVFVSIPGHFSWSFDDPLFRILLLRGIAWSGHAPVDRFNELVLPGARAE